MAIEAHIKKLDKSFSKEKALSYSIYSELSLHQYTLCVYDHNHNTFIGIEQYQFKELTTSTSFKEQLQTVLAESELLSLNVKQITVCYSNSKNTLVPNVLFNEKELKNYFNFNYASNNEDQLIYDRLINVDTYNVYTIPNFIVNCFDRLKNVRFKHIASMLIESNLITNKTNKEELSIHLNVLTDNFHLTVLKANQLQFHNAFEYQTSEDFIYYLLFALNQLEIDPSEIEITVSGNIEKSSALYEILFRYIKDVQFVEQLSSLKTSYAFDDILKHKYYSIFNQYLCE